MSFELSPGVINTLIYLALIIGAIKLLPHFIAEHGTKNAVGFLISSCGLIGVSFADMMNNLSAARILGSTNDSVMAYKALAVGVVIASIAIGFIVNESRNNSALKVSNWFRFGSAIGCILISAALTVLARSAEFSTNDMGSKAYKTTISVSKDHIKTLEKEAKKLDKFIAYCQREVGSVDGPKCSAAVERRPIITQELKQERDNLKAAHSSSIVNLSESVSTKTGLDGDYLQMFIIYATACFLPLINIVLSGGMFFFWGNLIRDHKKKQRNLEGETGGRSRTDAELFENDSRTESGTVLGTIDSSERTVPPKSNNNKAKRKVKTKPPNDDQIDRVTDAAVKIAIKTKSWPTLDNVQKESKVNRSAVSKIMKMSGTKKRITASIDSAKKNVLPFGKG